MKEINCLRCNEPMTFVGMKELQLGKTGWFLGDLPNLLEGALEVDIYSCKKCGKIEFFEPSNDHEQDSIFKRTCPKCGTRHDIDYPKCPNCKHDYDEKHTYPMY